MGSIGSVEAPESKLTCGASLIDDDAMFVSFLARNVSIDPAAPPHFRSLPLFPLSLPPLRDSSIKLSNLIPTIDYRRRPSLITEIPCPLFRLDSVHPISMLGLIQLISRSQFDSIRFEVWWPGCFDTLAPLGLIQATIFWYLIESIISVIGSIRSIGASWFDSTIQIFDSIANALMWYHSIKLNIWPHSIDWNSLIGK